MFNDYSINQIFGHIFITFHPTPVEALMINTILL